MDAEDEQQPIEEVLDDIYPEWREVAKRMAAEGKSDAEIVAHFRDVMHSQLDGMLDLYIDLGGVTRDD